MSSAPLYPNRPDRPAGRAADPVANGSASAEVRTAQAVKSGDEKFARPKGHIIRRRHVTASRLDHLNATLSARDWMILATLRRLRLASSGQLERLCFVGVSRRQARQSLASLVDRGVIARLARRIGGVRSGSAGYVYTLDIAGARLLAPALRFRRPDDPGERFVRHALAVTELYVRLACADRAGTIDLYDFVAEPASWRTFAGPYGPAVLKPDAAVVTRLGQYEDRWFVEVDRATEAASVVARKCETYRRYWQTGTEQERYGVFPRVLFLVPDERRQAALVEVFGRQPAEAWQLFLVAVFDDGVSTIARGAGL